MVHKEDLADGIGLWCGDCLEAMTRLEPESIDSCVTDPPYHLTSIVQRFGRSQMESGDSQPPNRGAQYKRLSRGFMGKQWDGGDIAFKVEVWEHVYAALKPGAHLIAFSGTRTYHRMVCAIEDAGFEIRDQIGWCFGSGFPKSHDAGNGWGTALKPAWEPIVLARKPLIGTVAQNVATYGVGALNINGCRIGDRDGRWPANIVHDGSNEVIAAFPNAPGQQYYVGPEHGDRPSKGIYGDFGARSPSEPREDGGGSAARYFYTAKQDMLCEICALPCEIDSCNAPTAGQQSHTHESDKNSVQTDAVDFSPHESLDSQNLFQDRVVTAERSSSLSPLKELGSAPGNAQMPQKSNLVQNVRSAGKLCESCAVAIAQGLVKAKQHQNVEAVLTGEFIEGRKKQILSRSLALYVEGRENTDTIETIANLRTLIGSVCHAIGENINSEKSEANIDSDLRRLRYSSKADSDDRLGSLHPTVKPLDLIQWLVRLVTPKGGVVLDPFAGTGTTAEAAFREGCRSVLIEREVEYQNDIRRRVKLLLGGPEERAREGMKASGKTEPLEGLPLFSKLALD